MSFLLRWLGRKENPRIGLRPHKNVELPLPFDAAYDRVLGAYISIDDRRAGFVEAAFGLVNNERVRCSLERIGDDRTSVRVEAFFPAGAVVPERSPAVDALVEMLSKP
jgi:hypothetical protein